MAARRKSAPSSVANSYELTHTTLLPLGLDRHAF
jgi:hypothetical protein